MVAMVPVDSAIVDNMRTNAVTSENGQNVHGENGSMIAINDASAGVVIHVENEENKNAVVDDVVYDDEKENYVGDNVGSVALTQSVSNNEKKVERHSIKLSNCKHFTIKLVNSSK